jgi:hypothetical protein
MKKFEVINSTWVKKLDLYESQDLRLKEILYAIRLKSIIRISSTIEIDESYDSILPNSINTKKRYIIDVGCEGSSGGLTLYYDNLEEEQYKLDLAFLENIFKYLSSQYFYRFAVYV